TAADHPAEVVGVDPDLEQVTAALRACRHLDVVRVVDDAAHQVLESVREHQASASASSDSSALVADFFSAAFALAFSASAWTASTAAELSPAACLVRRVPSAPGRPLNFCQSPVTRSRAATCSVGCAPTPSQYWARSELMSMSDGS